MSAFLLILLGGIVTVGFLGNIFFEKTRIPDILFLIAVGIVLGPIMQVVPPDSVRIFMNAFGAIALTIILFEGGLDLDIKHTIHQVGRAFLLAVVSFTCTIFLVYYSITVGLNISGRIVWAVAAALACTSAPIVIPVLNKIFFNSHMRPLLAVESALSDALSVMTVLALINLEQATFSGSLFLGAIGKSLLIGAGAALLCGIIWLWLLSHLYNLKFFYLMTLGFVFLLMGAVESFHGSGALAVLVFGIVLANGQSIIGLLNDQLRRKIEKLFADGQVALHPKISESHTEISFLIRSFFFVYLGIIFKWPGSNLRMWLTIVITSVAIIISREIAVQLVGWTTRLAAHDRQQLNIMLPRGLATAVLASMLAARAAENAPSWETLATFIVVVSNFWMTIKLLQFRRRNAPENSVEIGK
jgi:cell volume regulation protein A